MVKLIYKGVFALRKMLTVLSLCGITALSTACQADLSPNERAGMFHGNNGGTTLNVYDRNDLNNNATNVNNQNNGRQFGYVREQRNPNGNVNEQLEGMPTMDYEQTANAISKMLTTLPNILDVATVVTDEEVLIAYQTDSNDRKDTADMVSKSALSVVPRYYHVYVSDNPRMIREIERFGLLTTDSPNVDAVLEYTIKEMLESPQGYQLNKGENANGEFIGGNNDELDENYNQDNKNR